MCGVPIWKPNKRIIASRKHAGIPGPTAAVCDRGIGVIYDEYLPQQWCILASSDHRVVNRRAWDMCDRNIVLSIGKSRRLIPLSGAGGRRIHE